MACYYLRHIDLYAVYEQLPEYECGPLANIPPPLCETLALYFELIAEEAAESYFELIAEQAAESSPLIRYWPNWDSSDLAAEVGDLIEIEIENLENERSEQAESCRAPMNEEPLIPGESLEGFLCFINDALSILETERDYFRLLHLLIYQYDALCSLYASGHMEAALDVFEAIAETRETLTHSHWLGRDDIRHSREARARAALRHAPTNQTKEAVLDEWEEYGGEYEGYSDFARIIIKRDNLKLTERTVARWLSEYGKTKD
jgi:hypothetical protein